MTDPTVEGDELSHLTYTGPLHKGRIHVPPTGRQVAFKRGEGVDFTTDELEHLDPAEWEGERIGLPVDETRTQQGPTLGPGDTGTLTDGDTPPAGTVDEVLAWVGDDPARARLALESEHAGKARTSLMSKLAAVTGDDTNPEA